jgi:hypothetical protein
MTATVLPTAWAALEAALRQHHPVRITYHDKQRLICPHALGWKSGRPMLLGYQTGGHTTTGTLADDPRKRWRCMYIDEIDHIDADEQNAWGTADNYNPTHPFPTIDHLAIAVTP